VILREPIVGWRQWNFMYPHFLANLGKDTIYVPREKIEARCEQEDHCEQQAPHLTCTCGIYAYKEKPRLLGEIRSIYGRPLAPPLYSGSSTARLTYGVRSSSMRMAIVRSSAIPNDSGAHRQSSRWLAGLVMSMACHAKECRRETAKKSKSNRLSSRHIPAGKGTST
jgi:hypothetical protein